MVFVNTYGVAAGLGENKTINPKCWMLNEAATPSLTVKSLQQKRSTFRG